MSRINDFVQRLYDLSSVKGYNKEHVRLSVRDMVVPCIDSENWYLLNNVFYNLEVKKLYIEVASFLLFFTQDYSDNMPMRKLFIQNCKDAFKRHPRFYDLIDAAR